MKADKAKVNRLLKTARGQIDGILKMVEEDRYCIDISNQLLATKSIINKVNSEILIEGMSCGHCSARVEKALNSIDGVSAEVNLDAKTAYIKLNNNISNDILKNAIEDAGYTVISIS